MNLRRRTLLGATSAAAVVGAGTIALGTADATGAPVRQPSLFEGAHQAGILQPRQAAAAFVAFDLTSANRGELRELMRALTERARFLTRGGRPVDLGVGSPPSDSGILGPVVPVDGLSLTLGLGASTFDDRFGLRAARPRRLRRMDTFPDDDLDRARCDGDLLLQVCGGHPDTVLHALRDLTRHTRGGMQVRWREDGYTAPPRPTGVPRNLLGFNDGIVNPAAREADRLVWAGPGEPAWARGGSYQVIRTIRMLVEFWDRVTLGEQERMIGRRRDSGAPLSGNSQTDVPSYANDPVGATTPLDAHIRLANPRTPATDDSRFLRRGYNYDRGVDLDGNLDMGLVFSAFCQDLDRQFVTVQNRLEGEPLIDYISPVGGGYFFALPGVRDASDYYARDLLA